VTKDQFGREKNFRTALVIAKRMLSHEIITQDDFNKLRKMFVEKYRPVIGSL
jgi:hypothetical protein